MDAKTLRQKFIDFFKQKGHVEVLSASLVPNNDPTVLFNTAGMQPLVPYLLGQKHPLGKRLVNVQKCLRTVDFEGDCIGESCTPSEIVQLFPGWNLIGHMCSSSQNIADIPSFRSASTHNFFILNYNGNSFGICSLQGNDWVCDAAFGSAVLEPGKGYWIFSDIEIPYTNIC